MHNISTEQNEDNSGLLICVYYVMLNGTGKTCKLGAKAL